MQLLPLLPPFELLFEAPPLPGAVVGLGIAVVLLGSTLHGTG